MSATELVCAAPSQQRLRRSSESAAAPSQQRCAHHERSTGLPARRHTIIKTIINHHQMCHPSSPSGN